MGRYLGWAAVLGILAVSCGGDDAREDALTGPPLSGSASLSATDTDPSGDAGDSGILDVGGADGGSAEAGDGGEGDTCPCQNVMDGIYVLNSQTPPSVWFFDPPANTFTQVGTLGCNAPIGWTANSMAIDRDGNAWVNYYDALSQTGKMFRAPLSDLASCEERGYQNQAGEWFLLGMGYAVVSNASDCDELFIYKSDRYLEYPNFTPGGSELGRYNTNTDQIEVIGPTDYPVGELTGTGDARLFTFATVGTGQAVLVALDKDTGGELENTPLNLDITNAFAFAFWGGDVYFFTETAPGSGVSQVSRLDYDGDQGGGLSVYNPSAGIHIPGAGVSTCASFTPPA